MDNKSAKIKVLYVCTQNVFRSMSADYLSKKHLKENNIKGYDLDSCGTIAYSWESPYEHTLKMLKSKGIDARAHKNKQINQKLVDESRFVICMTNDHKEYIIKNFNVTPYLFNELAFGAMTDLEDDNEASFNCSLTQFIEKTINHIDKHIPKIFESLEKIK